MPLLLPSLEIDGYRAIRQLKIETLGRVNLFVGKNNVGKTSLLEAIRLYVSRNAPTVFSQLFVEKSEYRLRSSASNRRTVELAEEFEAIAADAEAFFYGCFSGDLRSSFRIGTAGLLQDVLEVSLPWAEDVWRSDTNEALSMGGFIAADSSLLSIQRGDDEVKIPFDWFFRHVPLWPGRNRTKVLMIPATGWEIDQIARSWDVAVESGLAPEVERALRMVVPELERIYLIGEMGTGGRVVKLGIAGASRPVPLSSMGDGVNRVFGIALALVQAQEGALLIDEIENGLHYTVQQEVWKAILKLSEEFRVQVFATTHSWDAVVGFQEAANGTPAVGMLYRLEREADGSIYPESYTERELAIAASQQIEVR